MFDTQFEAFLADSPAARTLHYRIRYRVFCLERGFEDPASVENGEEKDKWDADSIAFVVRDKGTRRWSATARLILPVADRKLPVEEHSCLGSEIVSGIDRHKIAEVSRICVVKGDALPFYSEIGPVSSRKKESEVLLGLIRSLMHFSLDFDRHYLHMLITPAFSRLLRVLGVSFVEAGSPIEHRGTRVPYLIDVKETQRQIASKDNAVSAMFEKRSVAYKSFRAEERIAAAAAKVPVALTTTRTSTPKIANG